MDREALIKKREALKAKLKLEYRRGLICDVLESLDTRNIDYAIRFDYGPFEWIADRFPIPFFGIDWSKVPGMIKIRYADDEEKERLISQVVAENLKPSDGVTVIWGNASNPNLELKADAVIHHTAIFTDECEDLWVTCPDRGFCLECSHNDYVAYKAGLRAGRID